MKLIKLKNNSIRIFKIKMIFYRIKKMNNKTMKLIYRMKNNNCLKEYDRSQEYLKDLQDRSIFN